MSFAAKLKGVNYKEFALQYAERIGFGVIALVAFTCVVLTSWAGISKTPNELADAAKKAEQQVTSSVWPEPEKAQFQVVNFVQQGQDRTKPLDGKSFEYRTLMSFKLYPREEPVDEPKLAWVEDLKVYAGTFVMATVPAGMEGMPGYPDGTDPMLAGVTGTAGKAVPAGDVDDDNVRRTTATGDGAVGPGGIGPMGMAMPMPGGGHGAAPGGKKGGGSKSASPMPASSDAGGPAAKGKGKGKGKGGPADVHASAGGVYLSSDPMGMMGMGMEMAGSASLSTGRGVRYVSLRGVFPLQKQLDSMKRALRVGTSEEAAAALEFHEFKIQRQKAIGGPDPWAGPWEELSTQPALDLLSETAEFDVDIVATEVINQVFTMPLPYRVKGNWKAENASHPLVEEYQLDTKVQQEKELALNQVAAEEFDENGMRINSKSVPKGFASVQKDMGRIRQTVAMTSSMDPSMMMQRVGKIMGMGDPMAMQAMMGDPMGMGMQRGGMEMLGVTIPKYLLFRYFDVAVEPGECYRYKVQLVILNPNFGLSLEQVKDPTITEGETRATEWSAPSPPVVVDKDVDFFLARVQRTLNRPTNRVSLDVFQWDPEVGTLVGTKLSVSSDATKRQPAPLTAINGQYVGGKSKALRLDAIKETLADEEVTFNSKDILVDSAGAPYIETNVNSDLRLSPADWKLLADLGRLDQIVTVNQYGELVAHDSISKAAEKRVQEQKLKAEQKHYEDLLNKEDTTGTATGLSAFMPMPGTGEEGMERGGKKAKKNPARVGGKGGKGGAAGMPMGMP